jgi:hypothetical protein
VIGVYELTVLSPGMAIACVLIGVCVAIACHAHRDMARERHHKRKNGGL